MTGSKHLVRFSDGKKLLLDCGLFQGAKEWRLRNWAPFPIPCQEVDWLVLTHAHLDHVGFLPRLHAEGFQGEAICTSPTQDLAAIVLPDSGHLQEEEAAFANKQGYSKHKVALPLYTVDQAHDSLKLLTTRPFHADFPLGETATGKFLHAGHILGSGFFELTHAGKRILFSGDLGRPPRPEAVFEADYLVLESTYGNRLHSHEDPRPKIAEILYRAKDSGGTVIIPAFAVERTEKMIFLLKGMMEAGTAPRLPVFIDSPMAIEAVKTYVKHPEEHDATSAALIEKYGDATNWPGFTFCKTRDESIAINKVAEPHIIVSASGMLSGGRVLHHLERHLGNPKSTVMIVGFQPPGGRGRSLQDGAATVRMFGVDLPVRCRVETLDQFSDHADYEEILGWLRNFKRPPVRTFLVHGEPSAAEAMRQHIVETFRWDVHVARYMETVNL